MAARGVAAALPLAAGSSPKWCMSEKTCRFFSDTRSVPIADRQSVHGMAVIAGWIELITGHPTSYERPPGSHITSQERYKTTNILAFREHADRAG